MMVGQHFHMQRHPKKAQFAFANLIESSGAVPNCLHPAFD